MITNNHKWHHIILSWALKNWWFWTVVLEKTLESPLDCKEIQPVYPKGDQSWIFIGRTDVEAETPILWPPDANNWLFGEHLMLGKTEGRRIGDNRGWYGWMASLIRWTWIWANSGKWWWTGRPGVLQSMGDGQGGQVCCSPWADKESDTSERLNWTEF